jgi:hypothetical protein
MNTPEYDRNNVEDEKDETVIITVASSPIPKKIIPIK